MAGTQIAGKGRKALIEAGAQPKARHDKKAAIGALGHEQGAKALQPDTHKATTPGGANELQRWVQAALNRILGLKLPVDGVMDSLTRQALQRFQRQEGLLTHGYADERTIQVLELRIGVACPRGAGHEPVPWLLRRAAKTMWMPRPKGQTGNERDDEAKAEPTSPEGPSAAAKAKIKAKEPEVANESAELKHARELQLEVPEVRAEASSPKDSTAQHESLRGARELALSERFVERAAEELGRSDIGQLREEIRAWVDNLAALNNDQAPAWLRTARADARPSASNTASLLRQAWWTEKFGPTAGI